MTTEEKIMTYIYLAALFIILPFCMLCNLISKPLMPKDRRWR